VEYTLEFNEAAKHLRSIHSVLPASIGVACPRRFGFRPGAFLVFRLPSDISALGSADITIHKYDGTDIKFPSVAIKYEGNSITFSPVTALLWRANVSDDQKMGSVIPGKYIPSGFRFIDLWLVWAMKYQPPALIVHSGTPR
jgi:hypothetical protein